MGGCKDPASSGYIEIGLSTMMGRTIANGEFHPRGGLEAGFSEDLPPHIHDPIW